MSPLRLLAVITLALLLNSTAVAGLEWAQVGGTGTVGSDGEYTNSYIIVGGGSGSVTFVANGTVLSYGTITDGSSTLDYAVTFAGGVNDLKDEVVNNAFVIHGGSPTDDRYRAADFYSSIAGKHGSTEAGTFADNGAASIKVSFYQLGTFDNTTGTGASSFAAFSLLAINEQPIAYGGNNINKLSSSEFYDIDWGGGGTVTESDSMDQVVLDQTAGLNRLANYDPTRLPIGSTGVSDPGTGGFTDPLLGDLRLEFDKNHNVSDAEWEVHLPVATEFIVSRTGDDGSRSGIGFGGSLSGVAGVPEPSSLSLTLLLGLAGLTRRRRSKA